MQTQILQMQNGMVQFGIRKESLTTTQKITSPDKKVPNQTMTNMSLNVTRIPRRDIQFFKYSPGQTQPNFVGNVQGKSIEGASRNGQRIHNMNNAGLDSNKNGGSPEPRTISGATTAAATSKVTLERCKTHENIKSDVR